MPDVVQLSCTAPRSWIYTGTANTTLVEDGIRALRATAVLFLVHYSLQSWVFRLTWGSFIDFARENENGQLLSQR